MSTGDQIVEALIASFFDVFVSILLASFDAIVLPILQSMPGLLGIDG